MTGHIGGFHSLAPAPVSIKHRFLLLDDQGRERRIGATLADYVREPRPRSGRSAPATAQPLFPCTLAGVPSTPATARAAMLTSPYVSAVTAYTPASQAPALVRSMASSSISLSLTSPNVTGLPRSVDGSISPVPSDGSNSPVPSDGSLTMHGGVGTEVHEDIVAVRYEKKKVDKT